MKLAEIITEVRSWKEDHWMAFAHACAPLIGIAIGVFLAWSDGW